MRNSPCRGRSARGRLELWGKATSAFFFPFYFLFSFIFISWRLITLQYCSSFCHTLTWIRHGFTWVPHPNSPSCLPPHPIPLGLPSAAALSTCLMHPTWAGDLFHPQQYTCFNAVLSEHPTLALKRDRWLLNKAGDLRLWARLDILKRWDATKASGKQLRAF